MNFFFYIQEDLEKKLRELISTHSEEAYELEEDKITPEDINVLMKRGNKKEGGYMDKYTYLGELNKNLPDSINWQDDDPFYKGQIVNYCTYREI